MDETARTKSTPTLKCGKVTLVPYEEKMIDRYCSLFLDDFLRLMTATDHLTIDEAREAHHIWTNDADKTMFIVLDNELLASTGDDVRSMIGDGNIVMLPQEQLNVFTCEIMLMIGEPAYRGKGLGGQILCALMRYALDELDVTSFEAHIKSNNSASLRLFTNMGYKIEETNSAFEECILRLKMDENKRNEIVSIADSLSYVLIPAKNC